VIDLPTNGRKIPANPRITPIIKTATFQLHTDYHRAQRMSRYKVQYKELAHPVLRHPLLVLEVHRHARCQPYDDLLARLDEMTRMELMKIPADKRPPAVCSACCSPSQGLRSEGNVRVACDVDVL
jgi:hypothetical protein